MKSLLLAMLVAASALPAAADWGPDPEYCSVWMDYAGPDPISLFVVPDGSGPPLTAAMTGYGATVDATVHLLLVNYGGTPIVDFPAEDMWLASADDGLVLCALGAMADGPTDAGGEATWSGSLRGGGSSVAVCYVVVNGLPMFTGLPLHFNSADLNGDLVVNLADVARFAMDFYGPYRYRSDFYHDGVLNLYDLGRLAASMQAACP